MVKIKIRLKTTSDLPVKLNSKEITGSKLSRTMYQIAKNEDKQYVHCFLRSLIIFMCFSYSVIFLESLKCKRSHDKFANIKSNV